MTRARDTADAQDNLGGAVAPFVAGKNFQINGGFDIWQRGTTLNAVTHSTYTADQWIAVSDSIGTINITQQNIAAQGLGVNYCMRVEKSAGASNRVVMVSVPEGALSCVGKTVTLSGYLRKGSALTSNVTVDIGTRATRYGTQYDGIVSSTISNASLNSSTFTKFSYSFNVTTTTSTNNANLFELEILYTQAGGANVYLEIAAIQIEVGSAATPFSRAGGTLAGELAACQRYYFRTQTGTGTPYMGVTVAGSSTTTYANVIMKQTMRSTPTAVDFSLLRWQAINNSGNITAASIADATPENVLLNCTTTGATTAAMNYLIGQSAAAYVGFSAEL